MLFVSNLLKVEKLCRLHEHIQRATPLTPRALARSLEISQSTLYNYIDELRQYGADVRYNKLTQTFSYVNRFEFTLIIRSSDQYLVLGDGREEFMRFLTTPSRTACAIQ